jgi:hypothetical protein
MKALSSAIFALLTQTMPVAVAQQVEPFDFGMERNFCMSMMENDINGDIVATSGEKPDPGTVCDCADARMANDPVVKKIENMPRHLRRKMPQWEKLRLYVTVKHYGASLACYGAAVGASADKMIAK